MNYYKLLACFSSILMLLCINSVLEGHFQIGKKITDIQDITPDKVPFVCEHAKVDSMVFHVYNVNR